jgi:hypothetical protein
MIGGWATTEVEKQMATTFSEKRIRQYDNTDMSKLMELIGEWRYLLGLTSQVSDKELIIMTKFVSNSFPQYTYTDIKTAMMMALQGKLDIPFTPLVNFSAKYIADALNEYGYIKSKFVNETIYKNDKKLSSMGKPRKYTPEERMAIFADILSVTYKIAVEKGEVIDIDDKIYKWLRATNQLVMSKEEINEAVRYANDKYNKDTLTQKSNFYKVDKDTKLKKYGREHVIVKYFVSNPLTKILSYLKLDYFK